MRTLAVDGGSGRPAGASTMIGMTQAARRSDDLRRLAQTQHGLLTFAQLASYGVSYGEVRSQVDARRWQVLSRRVVALHNGDLDDRQEAWFAVLDGGPECAVAGVSALHEFGLKGFDVERWQAAVPPGLRGARHDRYVRRRSRRLVDGALHPARSLPTMRPAVALVDALENTSLPLRGCALLAAVVQQRLFRPGDVRPLVEAESTLPHRGLYLATAGDIEGGSHSLLEIDFVKLARAADIPAPLRQVVRADRSGRRRHLDADFDGFVAEVDGALHLKPLAWWDDMFRQNDLVIGGRPMVRFASVGIRLFPDRVIDQLRAAAERWL
jgi:hypothetical protein